MLAVNFALTFLLVAFTLMPLLRREEWWVRAFDFPRPQILTCGLLTAASHGVRISGSSSVHDRVALGAVVLTIMLQTQPLLPFTPLVRMQVRCRLVAYDPPVPEDQRLLDPRIGRGIISTFHARVPFLRFRLDHLFHTPDFAIVDIRRRADFGSDHFPLLVRLSLEPPRGPVREAPQSDAEDWDEARSKLEQARRRVSEAG